MKEDVKGDGRAVNVMCQVWQLSDTTASTIPCPKSVNAIISPILFCFVTTALCFNGFKSTFWDSINQIDVCVDVRTKYLLFFPLFFATLFYMCMFVGWLISLIYFNALPKEQLIWGMAGVGDRWRTVLSPHA